MNVNWQKTVAKFYRNILSLSGNIVKCLGGLLFNSHYRSRTVQGHPRSKVVVSVTSSCKQTESLWKLLAPVRFTANSSPLFRIISQFATSLYHQQTTLRRRVQSTRVYKYKWLNYCVTSQRNNVIPMLCFRSWRCDVCWRCCCFHGSDHQWRQSAI